MDDFPRILKELRQDKGLNQLQLANALGFKRETTINQWEKGKRMPDIVNLKLLSKFFNVSIDYLVGNER